MTELHKVGTLDKGDPCLVHFPDGRKPWFCRVSASLPYGERTDLDMMYECITPHGSVVITGAVWVSPMSKDDQAILANLESAARQKKVALYKGRIRAFEENR